MPHRVLVVDDEEPIRTLIQDFLESRGYRVVQAHDGDAGIRAFTERKPHLLIIDFLLPRKNGFAVAEAVRNDPHRPHVPIIMMSGVFKNPKTAVEARDKYQVLDFLSKPLNLDGLGDIIDRALENVEADEDSFVESAVIEAASRPDHRPPLIAPSVARASSSRPDEEIPPRGLSYQSSVSSAGAMEHATEHASSPPPRNGSAVNMIQNGVYQGRPFPELPEEGDVDEFPVALLLSTIRYDQSTGMLDMTDSGTHRRIYIINGNPTFMQSNAEGENVGALLLRRGRITEPDFERCLRYMKDKGRTLQQSLLEMRLVSESDLATAYKLLAGQLLPLALGMAAGTFRWRITDAFVGRVPEGKFEPVSTLFDGIKRHVHPPQILKFFRGREDVPLIRTNEFERLMPFFRRSFSAGNVSSEVDGSNTYRTITRAHTNDAASAVPQLFALVASGMAVLPENSVEYSVEVAVNAAAAEVSNLGEQLRDPNELDLGFEDDEMLSETQRAKSRIAQYYEEIMSQDFFQIMGATRTTSEETIKSAYFELAKKWHTDAFAGIEIGPVQQQLDEIFARITEAYETITHKTKREEYVTYLDRKAKGLPTDVNEVFKAEQLFDQGLAMVRRRDWGGAKQVLQDALQLNPDPLYFATLGWVVFNTNPKSQVHVTEAVQHIRKAVTEQENLPVAYQYLGQIAFTRGQYNEAKKWWQRCLEWEPNNIDASRGLRMVNSRQAESSTNGQKGILSKFLTKK